MTKKCNKVVKPLLTGRTKSHIIPVHPSKTGQKWGINLILDLMKSNLLTHGIRQIPGKKRGVCMLTLHSFLQSVVLFVKALAVKVKKEQYRTSSVVMAGAVVIAIVPSVQTDLAEAVEMPWLRPGSRKAQRSRKNRKRKWYLEEAALLRKQKYNLDF